MNEQNIIGEKLFLTGNGFEYLDGALKRVYGERGSAEHNLLRYVNSEFFQSGCRISNSIDDIPEISFEEIKNLIDREARFKGIADLLCKKYDELRKNDSMTEDDYLEVAGILGIAPGHTDRIDTLFPNLLDLYVSTQEEAQEIISKVNSNKKVISSITNDLMDSIREYHIYKYNGRDLLSKGYARNYFRGECAYYGTSKASLFRKDTNETQVIISISKLLEFCRWLNSLSIVNNWNYGNVYHGAIAQHYGIPTFTIDITSDILVALFFACCEYDYKNEVWLPLTIDKFEKKESRNAVYKLGGDSRYGILYSASADICELSRIANSKDIKFISPVPVGIQPFQRCEYQSAYLIEATKNYDLLKDPTFSKVKFRLTEEICNYIYEKMDKGRLIYPNESDYSCEIVTKRINDAKALPIQTIEKAIEAFKTKTPKETIIKNIKSIGYEISDALIDWSTKEESEKIETSWYNNAKPINPTFRFGFCI